jgi:hypothetical protein
MSAPAGPTGRGRVRPGDLVPLALGAAALALGTAMGWDARLVEAVVAPPPLIRAALVAVAVLLALAAFRRGLVRISEGRDPGAGGPAALIGGVRLVFLALAGLAAAAGWLVGHPLPLIVALVIAPVDVLETTFLLVVLGTRRLGGRD